MLELPQLQGYVQNRPLAEWWVNLPYLACSETWFEDRDAERTAYASDWYRERIAVDEARIFAREQAWSSPVVEVEVLHDGPVGRFRALSFGGSADSLHGALLDWRVELLHLLRPAPAGAQARVVVSAWSDEPEHARELALRLGQLVFVAEPAASLPPPARSA
jgi:hypothetical protein